MNTSSTININPQILELPQCDYSQLFSHLPLSFQFIQQTANQQLLQSNIQLPFSSPISPSPPLPPASITPLSSIELLQVQYQQRSAYKLCFALVSLLFGLFYSLIGYRFLKLSSFFIGFSLGSSVIYLILSEQKQLTLVENLIISLSIGVLFAFVALLVQFIGLFLLGITSSTSIVTCILILIDLFYTNKSAWLCIGLLFVCATILASFSLKFQKSLTILNTSCIGCGLLLISLDFFVENNLLIDYIIELYKVNGNSFNVFERQKALLKSSSDFLTTIFALNTTLSSSTTSTTTKTTTTITSTDILVSNLNNSLNNNNNTSTSIPTSLNGGSSALALFLHLYSSAHARLCWYTWLVFGSYFIMLFASLLVQFLLTGKNYDHRESWHKLIKGSRKKKSANLEKIRLKSHLSDAGASNGHHHHHHHHHTGTIISSSSNNIGLISTESSLSRNSDLESSCQNDTLLLVDSKKLNTQSYTVSSTSENAVILNKNSNNHKSRSKHQSRRNNNINNKQQKKPLAEDSENSSSLEVIAFEAVANPKKKEKSNSSSVNKSSKSKTSHVVVAPCKEKASIEKSSNNNTATTTTTKNTLTTTSTSSTGSSASSTCQLIPLKLNNPCLNEAHIVLEEIQPSAPPCPTSPPPIPTIPPPKLPQLVASLNTTLNNQTLSNMAVNPLIGNLGACNITKNISKIKSQNRMSSKDKDLISSNDKFRHFYQIRRNNGDVLSQDFINNIQSKLSSTSQLNNSSLNLNPLLETSQSTNRSASLNSKENNSKKKKTSK